MVNGPDHHAAVFTDRTRDPEITDITIQAVEPGRRRRFTPEQKRAFLDEAGRTGNSISEVARRYGLSPSMLFQWKRAMDDATKKGLKSNEKVVPESEVKKLKARIRQL